MTYLQIGRVRNNTFENLTKLTADNGPLHSAIIKFIDEAGLGDTEIIGFGNDTAQLLRAYLDDIDIRVKNDYVASKIRETAKVKVLSAIDPEESNDPFVILVSNRLDHLPFNETIAMINEFNRTYTDASTADALFVELASRSPVGLLDAAARKQYAYDLLNWRMPNVSPVVRDVLFKVISLSPNSEADTNDLQHEEILDDVLVYARKKFNHSATDGTVRGEMSDIIDMIETHLEN